ncbi:MAG: hypothetical protein WCV99_05255 [Sterolibacterium sp.]|jgi:hypothetical protein
MNTATLTMDSAAVAVGATLALTRYWTPVAGPDDAAAAPILPSDIESETK